MSGKTKQVRRGPVPEIHGQSHAISGLGDSATVGSLLSALDTDSTQLSYMYT
jgi:hypothetical protein